MPASTRPQPGPGRAEGRSSYWDSIPHATFLILAKPLVAALGLDVNHVQSMRIDVDKIVVQSIHMDAGGYGSVSDGRTLMVEHVIKVEA